jgi:hypothetical protein
MDVPVTFVTRCHAVTLHFLAEQSQMSNVTKCDILSQYSHTVTLYCLAEWSQVSNVTRCDSGCAIIGCDSGAIGIGL